MEGTGRKDVASVSFEKHSYRGGGSGLFYGARWYLVHPALEHEPVPVCVHWMALTVACTPRKKLMPA